MTCIVGLIDPSSSVYMGSDSGASSDDDMSMILTSPKIYKKGEMLIGGTGQVRMNQLIQYKFTLPEHIKSKDTMHYMATDFVESLQTLFAENDFGEGSCFEGELMVAYRGQLFRVQPNYQVIEGVKNYTAIGNGEPFALGAFHALEGVETLTSSEKIMRVLEACTEHCAIIQRPYVIHQTEVC